MRKKQTESLWSRYWKYECEIRQYCFGINPSRILDKIDTDIFIDPDERMGILRMLGFDPDSAAVWIGINKECITINGHTHWPGRIFAGDGKEPHSRFAVMDGSCD